MALIRFVVLAQRLSFIDGVSVYLCIVGLCSIIYTEHPLSTTGDELNKRMGEYVWENMSVMSDFELHKTSAHCTR